ncbi:MAG: tRNA pseudouridine(38-40) synthase TruA [Anaerolineales bacterium]|nr:tRNA pseudouridine(38-40) synthase TruA [Anaerolineales bacterium]
MARYQAILAYDGSGFQGSQRQANIRTVQGEFEKALGTLNWSAHAVILSGRTDSGVHATGQVVAFDLEWAHSADALLHALNANLPHDLAVRSLSLASEDFHPRFDAVSRKYRYRLFGDAIRDPLREKFLWRVHPPVDGNALSQNAGVFLGTHDFAAFGSPTTPKGTTTRTVTESEWKQMPDGEWRYEVRADAFLYRMVRRLVFAQVSLAQGRLSAADIQRALAKQGKFPTGMAPAQGLTLVEVMYGSKDPI